MNLMRIRQSQSKLLIFSLIGFVYFLQFYGIWQLPFMDHDFPRPWDVYFARSVQVVISLFFIWLVAPKVFERFSFRFKPRTLRIGIIFTIFAATPNIYYFGVNFDGYWDLFSGIVFALAIGVDEEIYDRGFVFGSLERFGMEFALAVSAILFGLAHFPNYLFGDESFDYVIGHMVDSASFGYLMATLMLLTGNLWLPILVHGLIDLPWVMMPKQIRTDAVTGATDWPNVLAYSISSIIIARLMIIYMKGNYRLPARFEKIARYLGLIE